ncbi:hypothetical protein Lfu02_01360 [Longispora fulva]|uniref:BT-1020-like structural beta-sandwich domain-containing protein n=1 Tax=Longispora fulva TaxID=619741 RepID=A0A8J7KIC0_9ACTN|nr:right-handed parallel beta-helix repeat-containing protein [Longispora fulva]MBG6135994.1 hypothetical protein [Longispora fulva]GIG55764.1 hypothetical protein Lfu02_01360 [Longispora fulva]
MSHPRSTVLACAALLGVALAPAPAFATNTGYYVDCSAASNGTGTLASPFNNLAAVHAVTLSAGDTVNFQHGVTCTGQFAPVGSGTSSSKIVIGAYGTGTARPRIDANGATQAVLLSNNAYLTLQDLELTATGDNTTTRRGVYVYGADAGTLHGVTVRDLYIHDVRGKMPSAFPGSPDGSPIGKWKDASGGIVVDAQGGTTQTAFDGLLIEDNELRGVDREGIYFWSNWCRRPELVAWNDATTGCVQNWFPHTNAVIRGNRLYDIGGDGIVPKTATGTLVEHNTLIGFNRRSDSNNAGMWNANTVNTTFQYNEAAGALTDKDSMGFDVDQSTDGTVVQYNYSHDNAGGFAMICPVAAAKNFVIRNNISVNDGTRLIRICAGTAQNGQIYNNTMVVGNGLTPKVVKDEAPTNTRSISFTNNIVSNEGSGNLPWALPNSGFTIDHNAFHNVTGPATATNTVTAPHGLLAAQVRDPNGYRLGTGAATLGAGVLVSGNGGKDYFGAPVSGSGAPNIGAVNSAGACAPTQTYRFDTDTLGSGPAGWTSSGNVAVASVPGTSYPWGEYGQSVTLTRGATEARTNTTVTVSGDTHVSLRVRADQTTVPLGVHLLDASGVEVIKTSLAASGKLAYTANGSWTETGSYEAGQWYVLDIFVHPATGTYDFTVNGTPVVTGAHTGPSTNTITQARARVQTGSPAGSFGVDDLLVRPASC